MSVKGHQDIPFPDVGGESSNVSRIPPYPVISASYSLEDGEIVEGHFSGCIADTRTPSQRPNGHPQLHLSNQVSASTPAYPPAKPVESFAPTPTIEPSNTLPLS